MKTYLRLLRVKHYIKNALIFLPLLFARQLLVPELLGRSLLGFLAYSLTASVIYIINDIRDVERDRAHATKKNRPIASGAVSVGTARTVACVLAAGALALGVLFLRWSPFASAILVLYFVLNLLYSNWLKHVPIADIVILASGYVFRVLFGGAIAGIAVSHWLYLTVLAISFYLGLGKRRNELARQDGGERKVLRSYSHEFLDKNMYMFLGLTIMFYALWSVEISSAHQYGGYLIWTVPLVMVICMRYSMIVEGASDGDPVEVLLRDKCLLVLLALYAAVTFFIIYLPAIQARLG